MRRRVAVSRSVAQDGPPGPPLETVLADVDKSDDPLWKWDCDKASAEFADVEGAGFFVQRHRSRTR